MKPENRIVTLIPMNTLWDSGGPLAAARGRVVGTPDVVAHLRGGTTRLVIAECGEPLHWVATDAVYAVWKGELRPRLVEPDEGADKGFGFHHEHYPGGYCYVATEWSTPASPPILLFEMHH
jgi:hypothetical protein